MGILDFITILYFLSQILCKHQAQSIHFLSESKERIKIFAFVICGGEYMVDWRLEANIIIQSRNLTIITTLWYVLWILVGFTGSY